MSAVPRLQEDHATLLNASLDEVLSNFDIKPKSAKHLATWQGIVKRHHLEERLEGARSTVREMVATYPRLRTETVSAYLHRIFTDLGQPSNLRRNDALQRLLEAKAHLLWLDVEEAAEAKRRREQRTAAEAQRLAGLRKKACPPQADIDGLADAIARGAEAEAILIRLPELVAAHAAARDARMAMERMFAMIPGARAELGDAKLPPAPVRPQVRLEPDQLREAISAGLDLLHRLG